jgi:uncharacterized membrane protein
MNRSMTFGLSVLAGVALFEAALIPGVLIGGAAVLAPKYLPMLRRRLQPALDAIVRPRIEPPAPLPNRQDVKPAPSLPAGLGIKQAIAKTITFRIIVTTLDFTSNYVVIGELATAVGLSTFALIAGPLFYFAHETAWNYFGPSGTAVDLRALPPLGPGAKAGPEGFVISRALAKTITFRTIATVMDFSTLYVVIGELATAAGLTAFGFVVGPFVYFGHEMAWDYYISPQERTLELRPPTNLGERSATAGGQR